MHGRKDTKAEKFSKNFLNNTQMFKLHKNSHTSTKLLQIKCSLTCLALSSIQPASGKYATSHERRTNVDAVFIQTENAVSREVLAGTEIPGSGGGGGEAIAKATLLPPE